MVLAKTVPLTEADPLVALNVALAVVPGDAQGVPETPVQLVAEVSQVAPSAPVQVPFCAEAECGESSAELQMARNATRQGAGLESLATEEPWQFMVLLGKVLENVEKIIRSLMGIKRNYREQLTSLIAGQ
jgi:hypothetical protein